VKTSSLFLLLSFDLSIDMIDRNTLMPDIYIDEYCLFTCSQDPACLPFCSRFWTMDRNMALSAHIAQVSYETAPYGTAYETVGPTFRDPFFDHLHLAYI